MGLNDTPRGERVHIAFFGCRNVGKSSLVNKFTGQNLSIVSDTKGTTTDPVLKAMELLPLGPVIIIDTPGIDDEGELGFLRVEKTYEILEKTDIAILVADAVTGLNDKDKELIETFKTSSTPYIIAYNKCDLVEENKENKENTENIENIDNIENIKNAAGSIYVSATNNVNIEELKEMAARILDTNSNELPLISDIVNENDVIILVVPIDKAAPKGRLILPVQQVIRDAIDNGATPFICRETELKALLKKLSFKPKMVITDSQVFGFVKDIVPEDILLTSFSILMARYKGNLLPSVKSILAINEIEEGDNILISEGCTHHRQCGDIGSVKIPALIKKFTGKNPNIDLSSGTEFPKDLSKYKLIIHCGACMLTKKDAKSRYKRAKTQNIPMTNYGIALAYMNGILKRSVEVFPDIHKML
ncbi:MAG: [FeFe] hydrogenase H-cluster maturation GTPase HydF [Lachnospiraceae bacterium]|nr:[FeFe] hydrogenase H-cluster maturation GTPase HydF [Lachnospiraceae bacterium]